MAHIEDVIVDALIKIGEKGYGDEFGIGSSDSFNIIEVASMFKSEIEYLPERKGNRLDAEVITKKTKLIGMGT